MTVQALGIGWLCLWAFGLLVEEGRKAHRVYSARKKPRDKQDLRAFLIDRRIAQGHTSKAARLWADNNLNKE